MKGKVTMDLFLLYAYKGTAHRLAMSGLVTDRFEAEKWVMSRTGIEIPRYLKVAPDMLFYSVRVEPEDAPEFSFFAQAPLRATPAEVREKINAEIPAAIEEFIQKKDMVGHWHAGKWRIVEITQGY